jgi:hypothetical protein
MLSTFKRQCVNRAFTAQALCRIGTASPDRPAQLCRDLQGSGHAPAQATARCELRARRISMAVKIAINSFGLVETNAYLIRFDSVHGRFPGTVTVNGDTMGSDTGECRIVR